MTYLCVRLRDFHSFSPFLLLLELNHETSDETRFYQVLLPLIALTDIISILLWRFREKGTILKEAWKLWQKIWAINPSLYPYPVNTGKWTRKVAWKWSGYSASDYLHNTSTNWVKFANRGQEPLTHFIFRLFEKNMKLKLSTVQIWKMRGNKLNLSAVNTLNKWSWILLYFWFRTQNTN